MQNKGEGERKEQIESFRKAAWDLECDEDEAQFDKHLTRMAFDKKKDEGDRTDKGDPEE